MYFFENIQVNEKLGNIKVFFFFFLSGAARKLECIYSKQHYLYLTA